MITCEGMVTASLEFEAVPRLATFFYYRGPGHDVVSLGFE